MTERKRHTPIGRCDETFRRECEARLVLALGNKERRARYYRLILPKRDQKAVDTLMAEVKRQWQLKREKERKLQCKK